MARRVNVDYNYVGFRRGSRRHRWRRFALVAAAAVLLLALGLTAGRATWQAFRHQTSPNSHSLTSAQRGSLKQVANPAADDTGGLSLRLGARAPGRPTPAPAGAVASLPATG